MSRRRWKRFAIRIDPLDGPARVRANAAPDATHHLWPTLWYSLSHRPDVPRHVRWELLITLHTGDRVLSLPDVIPDDFTPLPKVTSREEGMRVRRPLDQAPSAQEWLLREAWAGGEGRCRHGGARPG
ncbi:hypothetical protein SSIG_01859 [Streptomyces filamentosus NRRL 11379]|uniref:Predicted protein n=1 Tax=Streptomyces filamentosus NRRL 15998 TaxID=457431 RepID=D6AAV9_STRFL|nr:predicted protein [Streptomyces filamentosus NRRL 15998]EWS91432.1 hypothetical protein SSIG_01859 [Streptomyces filamentosus NRRL 11379]